MFGGNPMAAMAVADVASQNPIIIVIILCIALCIFLAPFCCLCFWCCCCYWMCFGSSSEDFTVGSQKQKERN